MNIVNLINIEDEFNGDAILESILVRDMWSDPEMNEVVVHLKHKFNLDLDDEAIQAVIDELREDGTCELGDSPFMVTAGCVSMTSFLMNSLEF